MLTSVFGVVKASKAPTPKTEVKKNFSVFEKKSVCLF